MISRSLQSLQYLFVIALVTIVVAVLAWVEGSALLGISAAILGLYALHLLSLRTILQSQSDQWVLLQHLLEIEHGISLDLGEEAEKPVPEAVPSERARETADSNVTAAGRATLAERDAAEVDDELSEGTEVAPDMPASHEVWARRGPLPRDVRLPRRLALGTVAVVRNYLDPSDVAGILREQRAHPGSRFGEIAVQQLLLTEEEVEELLMDQQEGLFTEAEIESARQRLQIFRRRREQEFSEG